MFNRNHKMFITTFVSILFLTGLVFADPSDGCELDTNQLFLTADGAVLYNSNTDMAGFQFTVDGATASGASGGDAAAAGFTVSAGGSTVLGFSFSGATVSAGCGTLTNLALSGTATGLSNITVSDAAAQSVPFEYYDGSGGGNDCPSEVYDCAGVCDGDAVEDCAGECNGSAVVDECNECGGPGAAGAGFYSGRDF